MRPSRSKTRHVVPVVPWSIARIIGPRLPSAPPRASDVSELASAVGEAGDAPSRGAVLEVELVLPDGEPGPHGVDRHRRLHAVAGSEGHHGPADLAAHRALSRDRRPGAIAGPALDRPARESQGDAEATADAPRERPDSQI